jgi:hypothetical protein
MIVMPGIEIEIFQPRTISNNHETHQSKRKPIVQLTLKKAALLPQRGCITKPKVAGTPAHPGKTPPRCRIYPERVIHRTVVEPFQGTSHKNEPTQGAPGLPATLGYVVKPLRGRNPQ